MHASLVPGKKNPAFFFRRDKGCEQKKRRNRTKKDDIARIDDTLCRSIRTVCKTQRTKRLRKGRKTGKGKTRGGDDKSSERRKYRVKKYRKRYGGRSVKKRDRKARYDSACIDIAEKAGAQRHEHKRQQDKHKARKGKNKIEKRAGERRKRQSIDKAFIAERKTQKRDNDDGNIGKGGEKKADIGNGVS